jgi:signal transduction histidine kinase
MTNRRFHWRIRDLLILLLALTIAPFLALELFRAVDDVQRQGEVVAARSQTQAAEVSHVTDDFLQFTSRAVASYASAPSIQAMSAESSRGFLESIRTQHPNYEAVFLLTPDGTEVASTDPGTYSRLGQDHPFARETILSGRLQVSDMLVLPGARRPVVLLTYPVMGPNGAEAGVLGIALNLDRINSVLTYARLNQGTVVVLMQRNGAIIAGSPNARPWIGNQFIDGARMRTLDAGLSSPANVESFPDRVDRITAYQRLESAPWFVAAGIPQSEVNVARREVLARVGEEAAIAAIATLLLAWLMLRRVLKPIGVLTDGARQFAGGGLDRQIDLRREDELGTLADVLNGMAAKLKRRLDEDAEHAQALEALNRLQSDFVATASHELRTPVTAIRTYVEALLRPDLRDEGLRRECLEGINRTSGRLAHLVRRLLDVSRIDSGQIPLDITTVDATDIARASIARAIRTDSDSIQLRTPESVLVTADPDRLEEVLDNFIGNAIKFSQPNASVTVSIEQIADGALIAVRDSGPGVPVEELPRIFDRFYQAKGSMGQRFGGSGLGLYISRAYVEAMGGRIWVESVVRHGSTFFVLLPAGRSADTPRVNEEGDAAAAAFVAGR